MFPFLGARLAAAANTLGSRLGRRALPTFVSRMAAAIIASALLAGCMTDARPVAVAGDPANPSAGRCRCQLSLDDRALRQPASGDAAALA